MKRFLSSIASRGPWSCGHGDGWYFDRVGRDTTPTVSSATQGDRRPRAHCHHCDDELPVRSASRLPDGDFRLHCVATVTSTATPPYITATCCGPLRLLARSSWAHVHTTDTTDYTTRPRLPTRSTSRCPSRR